MTLQRSLLALALLLLTTPILAAEDEVVGTFTVHGKTTTFNHVYAEAQTRLSDEETRFSDAETRLSEEETRLSILQNPNSRPQKRPFHPRRLPWRGRNSVPGVKSQAFAGKARLFELESRAFQPDAMLLSWNLSFPSRNPGFPQWKLRFGEQNLELTPRSPSSPAARRTVGVTDASPSWIGSCSTALPSGCREVNDDRRVVVGERKGQPAR